MLASRVTAQTAQAEPEHELVFGEITVEVHGGSGHRYRHQLRRRLLRRRLVVRQRIPPITDSPRRPAAAGPTRRLGGLPSVNGQSNKCDAGYQEFGGTPVIASFLTWWHRACSCEFQALNTVANDTLHAAVESGDKRPGRKVKYLIDGGLLKTVDSGGVDVYIDVTGFPRRTRDPARLRPDRQLQVTAARTFTVDHSGPDIT